MLSLQLFVALTEIGAVNESIASGAVSVLLKYIAGNPEDFKENWATSQIEYVSLIRLVPFLSSFLCLSFSMSSFLFSLVLW